MLSGDPCRELPATKLRRFLGCRQNVVDFLGGQSVPWGLAASWIILKALLVLPSQPPVVCAPGDSQLTEDLAFWETGGSHLGQRLRLLYSAHPLAHVAS